MPEAFRSTCSPSSSPPPNATASVDCIPTEMYSVTYASYGTADDLHTAFEGFASPADLTNIDCAHDASGRHGYTVNGTAAGEVACYTTEGTGISTTDSVIVWTDDELPGPRAGSPRGCRGSDAVPLVDDRDRSMGGLVGPATEGRRAGRTHPGGVRGGGRDTWTLTFEDERYEESEFGPIYGDAEVFYAKPSTLLIYHRLPPPTFGGVLCPNYEEYRWRLRGEHLSPRSGVGRLPGVLEHRDLERRLDEGPLSGAEGLVILGRCSREDARVAKGSGL